MVAFETMHCINGRRKGKDPLMALKLDMSKAYDRVEWQYLEVIMRRLGFSERWISLMLMCISTVTYSVLINGEAKGSIVPSRGLRQGDLISPYLFLLCAEGLFAMLRKEEEQGYIRGVAVCKGAPQTSHLFFADDSIVFCRATLNEGSRVLKVLEAYEAESGQQLNKEKTSLFFSKNTKRETQDQVKQIFEAHVIQHHEKYLGLPPLVGKGKRKAFNRIKDQVGRKIAGWKGRLLSSAGREILIKAVAQATPTYTMGCFKLPDSLCKDLNSMMSNFWWGQKNKERKLAWVAWEKLCTPKEEGGLGFRDLRAFNLALLAKQGWRIQQNTNSLAHKVLKAKYFADRTFKEAQLGRRPSYIWRSIMAAKEIVEMGSRWLIGNGEHVDIWKDRWIPTPDSFKLVSPKVHLDSDKVAYLLDTITGSWDVDKVRHSFLPYEAEAILGISISPRRLNDSLIWAWTKNGKFSVKNAYKVAQKWLEGRSTKMQEFIEVVWEIKERKPDIDWESFAVTYKVNADGAVFKDIGCCGVGIVIRNDEGLLMGALSKWVKLPLKALESEARAMQEGVLLAWDLGLREIEIESDSLVVVSALLNPDAVPWAISKVIGVLLSLRCFKAWRVVHVRRMGNAAAHIMAREARSVYDCIIWVEDTPPNIAEQVLKDVPNLCDSSV
nr:uncharacterized protein LOC111989214 [Quercus suber]